MDKPEQPPSAAPGEPKASRLTTIVLIVALVLVVLVAGVLATVAVLMTRSPDVPLLGGAPPQRLATPIHFAPVRETKPAPCPGEQAVLDEAQTTCYLLEDGVTVLAVQRIQAVREKNGQYSVRIAVAAGFKEKLVQLIDEQVAEQRQVAVVLAPEQPDAPKTVVAAPIVTQGMDGDSLSITGFSQADAEELAAVLLGSGASPPASPAGSPPASQPGTDPGATNPGATNPGTTGTTNPGTTNPGTTNPGTTNPGTTGSTNSGTTGTGDPGGGPPRTNPASGGRRTPDPRLGSCKEAVARGYGPYSKGLHEEYSWYTDVDGNGVACNSADLR
ncbi:excalibur calcium-binding domain-containing protein [Nonomuraea pusilla]|uniref:excalibur calcium-binding domain-containing protein n=1 Tax=Nonomuraea pusilla TaxID=46177 RepID=UPI00331A3009